MRTFRIALITLALASACGGEESSSATPPSGAASNETAPAPAAEQPAAPRAPSARMVGTWQLSIPRTIPHLPEGQRHQVHLAWLAFRPEPPTEEELEANEFGTEERLGIFMLRRKQVTTPDDPAVVRARDGMRTMQNITLEYTADGVTLVTPDERETNTYEVVSDEGDTLVIDTTDDEGEVDRVEIVFDDDDRITITQRETEGDDADEEEDGAPQVMGFVRRGSAAAEAEALGALPETPPDGVDAPAALLGRWNAQGRRDGVEFGEDGRYLLHGLGGDIEGEYRVLSVDGENLRVRTRIGEFPWMMGDTIEIGLGEDQLSWHNTETDSRSTYVRQES